ncbi:MAG: YigZ family protein [Lactobacillus sp.]
MTTSKKSLTIKQNGENTQIIKKSRFIASMARTSSQAEAKAFIAQVKATFHDARHHTYAYLIGHHNEQVKASDNGEPSGTAGIPELKTLQLLGLNNVTVVVTRYFGGIKLGAGGLMRAYAGSVTACAKAIGLVQQVPQRELTLKLSYHQLGAVQQYLNTKQLAIADATYGAAVTLTVWLDCERVDQIRTELTNLLAGQVTLILGRTAAREVPIPWP